MAQKVIVSLAVLVAYLNFASWQAAPFAVVLGLTYLVLATHLLGSKFGPAGQGRAERLVWGLIAWAAAVAVAGAAVFYLWQLTPEIMFILLALVPWLGKAAPLQAKPIARGAQKNLAMYLLGAAYLVFTLVTFALIASATTSEAIRTPWQVVPGVALVAYALTAALLLVLVRYVQHPAWLVPFYLLTLSVLLLVYRLGYGFDPFIHQASEKIIEATGGLMPKPPYYVGQYALVLALRYVLGLPVALIDNWLVPGLASLTLPFVLRRAFAGLKLEQPWLLTLGLVPLALGLTNGFTYTTPQGLANLLALLTVLTLAARGLGAAVPLRLPWLMALTTIVVHPLTGLPLVGLTLLWWLRLEHPSVFGRWHRTTVTLAAAGTALVVPIAFMALSWLAPGAASVQFNPDVLGSVARLGQAMVSALPQLPRFTDVTDTLYLWGQPLTLVLLLLAALGWRSARTEAGAWQLFAWLAALPMLGYLVLALGFKFPNLPLNEQNFYTTRLWDLGVTCLIPLTLLGALTAGRWMLQRLPSYLPWLVTGSLVLTAGFYFAYPRFDRWHHDTAYNTTAADVAAAQLVESDAAGSAYVVLANQATSAAAIREFGFAHYYAGNFYYPLPTGTNPLYAVYLDAVERSLPTKATVAAATSLGPRRVYLVLNRYWANFLKLAPIAQKEANQYWQVADDRAQVYRYDY